MKRLGSYSLVLAGMIGLSTGCSAVRKVNYAPPPNTSMEKILSSRKVNSEELFKMAMQSLEESNLFNPATTSMWPSLEYFIKEKEEDYGGLYYPEKRRILVVIPKKNQGQEQFQQKQKLEETLCHELAHDYFASKLTNEEQELFFAKAKEYYSKFEQIQKKLGKGEYPSKGLLNQHGFTEKIYKTFKEYQSWREHFEKYYGPSYFEKEFFGSELFAFLAQTEISYKLSAIRVSNSHDKSILVEIVKRIGEQELKDLYCTPDGLKEAYKGFYNKDMLKGI
jgi:hypothetical protein